MGGRGSARLSLTGESPTRLGYVAGVIARAKLANFERVVFRATRGNMYLRHAEVSQRVRDPHTGELVYKSVFIIFFSGQRSMDKVMHICDSYGANRYNYPSQHAARQRAALGGPDAARRPAERHRPRESPPRRAPLPPRLQAAALAQRGAQAEGGVPCAEHVELRPDAQVPDRRAWCPVSKYDEMCQAVRRGGLRAGAAGASIVNVIDTEEKPPTYFQQNKFTAGFQGIVDGYGVPRCGEINPAAFTIITYPFLFGVMFGDVGHGIIVLCGALFFIRNEKRFYAMREDEIGDILGLPVARAVRAATDVALLHLLRLHLQRHVRPDGRLLRHRVRPAHEGREPLDAAAPGAVYPFGLDPAWHKTSNELAFANSYKMKLSIILGVLQMLLGLVCSLLNALHFKSELDVWCDFVPQAIFMLSVFGYLVFCIVYKWMHDWVALAERPPSLISMLIAFFMSPGEIPPDAVLYEGQAGVQLILVTLAFVTVPWMLFAKPYFLRRRHLAASGYKTLRPADDGSSRRLMDDDATSDVSDKNGKYHQEEFDFAEVCINQSIHTIEYVLGCISNTASYLRLWALSLAHKQLSVVFYEMILVNQGLARCKAAVLHVRRRPRARLHRVGLRHDGHPLRDGAPLGLFARAAPSLGRVPEQVLQGRR